MAGILDKIKGMFAKQPAADGAGEGATTTIKDKAGDVKDKAGDVAEKVAEKIPEPVKDAYEKVADKVEEIGGKLGEKMPESVKNAYDKVEDKVRDIVPGGDDATQQAADKIEGAANEAPG